MPSHLASVIAEYVLNKISFILKVSDGCNEKSYCILLNLNSSVGSVLLLNEN